MIHSGAVQLQRPYLRILSDDQLFEIRDVGVKELTAG
jgi:trimethylamine--corrinoid protein Co-methyltransferase